MEHVSYSFKLYGHTRYDEETKSFLSLCPRLNIYAQGHTRDEAKEALEESVLLYIETCYLHKQLDETLAKAGFTRVAPAQGRGSEQWDEYIRIAEANADSIFEMDIPFNIIVAEANSRGTKSSSPVCA